MGWDIRANGWGRGLGPEVQLLFWLRQSGRVVRLRGGLESCKSRESNQDGSSELQPSSLEQLSKPEFTVKKQARVMYGARLLSGAGPAQYGDGLQGLSLLRVGGDQGEVGFPHCGLLFSQEQQSSTTQTSFVSLLLFFFYAE